MPRSGYRISCIYIYNYNIYKKLEDYGKDVYILITGNLVALTSEDVFDDSNRSLFFSRGSHFKSMFSTIENPNRLVCIRRFKISVLGYLNKLVGAFSTVESYLDNQGPLLTVYKQHQANIVPIKLGILFAPVIKEDSPFHLYKDQRKIVEEFLVDELRARFNPCGGSAKIAVHESVVALGECLKDPNLPVMLTSLNQTNLDQISNIMFQRFLAGINSKDKVLVRASLAVFRLLVSREEYRFCLHYFLEQLDQIKEERLDDMVALVSRHGGHHIIKSLMNHMDRYNKSPHKYKVVVESLVAIGKPAIPELIKYFRTHESYLGFDIGIRKTSIVASQVLLEIGEEAIEPLFKLLNSYERDLPWCTVTLLSKFPNSTDLLVKALSARRERIRSWVVYSLSKKGEQVIPHLVEALEHEDWKIRAGAILALSKLDQPAELDKIVHKINDSSQNVQKAVAEALRAYKPMEVITFSTTKLFLSVCPPVSTNSIPMYLLW